MGEKCTPQRVVFNTLKKWREILGVLSHCVSKSCGDQVMPHTHICFRFSLNLAEERDFHSLWGSARCACCAWVHHGPLIPGHMLHGINEDIIHGFWKMLRLDDLSFLIMVILQKQQIHISAGSMFHGMAYMERAGMINVTTSVLSQTQFWILLGRRSAARWTPVRSVRQKSSWAETHYSQHLNDYIIISQVSWLHI